MHLRIPREPMIPDRLIKLRKEAGLTQPKLDDILHVKKHYISAYERGHNGFPFIASINCRFA